MEPKKVNDITTKLTTKILEFIKGQGYEIAPVGSTRTSSQWKMGQFRAQTKELGFIITIKPVETRL